MFINNNNIVGDYDSISPIYASDVYENYQQLMWRIRFELVDLDEMINDYGISYRNIWLFHNIKQFNSIYIFCLHGICVMDAHRSDYLFRYGKRYINGMSIFKKIMNIVMYKVAMPYLVINIQTDGNYMLL